MEVKKKTLTEEDVPVASFKAKKATSQYKTKSIKMKKVMQEIVYFLGCVL